jgi:hypothetical protein
MLVLILDESTKGDRCYGEKIYQHKRRIRMIAVL